MTKQNKKILFITHLYSPSIGGAEKVFQRLAEEFIKIGYDVTVLTSDATSTEQYFTKQNNSLLKEENINGVKIVRESIRSNIYKIIRPFTISYKLDHYCFPWKPIISGPHFFNAFKKINSKKFDYIIAGPTPTSAIYYGLIYKIFHPETKLIIFPHMHIEDRLHTTRLNLFVLKNANLVLSLTETERNFIIRKGIKKEKTLRIVNGIDEIVIKQKKKKNNKKINSYVLYLGQEGNHKNIPFLINSMIELWKNGNKTNLIIAGARTTYSEVIDAILKKLPKKYLNKITRLNNITDEQKIELLDNCLFLVNPSSFESFGIVFIEAWARKKAVIGSNIQAIREIINNKNDGLLFQNKNNNDLTKKIEWMLNNQNIVKKMGINGYKKVIKKFTWKNVTKKLEKSLREIP